MYVEGLTVFYRKVSVMYVEGLTVLYRKVFSDVRRRAYSVVS
jgi:hypothetical protein